MRRFALPNKFEIPELTSHELDSLSKSYNFQANDIVELEGGIMNRVYSINDSIVIKKVNPIYNPEQISRNIENQSVISEVNPFIAKVVRAQNGDYTTKIENTLFYITLMYKGKKILFNDIEGIIKNLLIIHNHFPHSKETVSVVTTIKSDLRLVLKKLNEFGKAFQIKTNEMEKLILQFIRGLDGRNWHSTLSWIHGDPTYKNIINSNNNLIIIDFDRAGMKAEIEDWGRLLCSVGLLSTKEDSVEKSIYKKSYDMNIFLSTLQTIQRVSGKKEFFEGIASYCQFFTIRRGSWEIMQDEASTSQKTFNLYLENTINKYYQLKNLYDQ